MLNYSPTPRLQSLGCESYWRVRSKITPQCLCSPEQRLCLYSWGFADRDLKQHMEKQPSIWLILNVIKLRG